MDLAGGYNIVSSAMIIFYFISKGVCGGGVYIYAE